MSVPFVIKGVRNPQKPDELRFYPSAVSIGKPLTLFDLASQIKERSSLSLGDIQSVLTNFAEVLSESIRNGQAVNIERFGHFHPVIKAVTKDRAEDVSVKDIKDLRVRFCPSKALKPNLKSNKPGEGVTFMNVTGKLVGGRLVLPEDGSRESTGQTPGEGSNGSSGI